MALRITDYAEYGPDRAGFVIEAEDDRYGWCVWDFFGGPFPTRKAAREALAERGFDHLLAPEWRAER